MNQLETLALGLNELRRVVTALDDSVMDMPTCCQPWTVRELASHALNSQYLWVSILTDEQTVSLEETMGAVPYQGALGPIADDAATRALAMWSAEGVLQATHSTPLGEAPGSTFVNFPIIDAFAHAWDISTALGLSLEFAPEAISAISAAVDGACSDATRSMGFFMAATQAPADATETERLMAATGRAIAH